MDERTEKKVQRKILNKILLRLLVLSKRYSLLSSKSINFVVQVGSYLNQWHYKEIIFHSFVSTQGLLWDLKVAISHPKSPEVA